jgi:hypothetical protein
MVHAVEQKLIVPRLPQRSCPLRLELGVFCKVKRKTRLQLSRLAAKGIHDGPIASHVETA